MIYRAIIFDLDGTLLNTLDDLGNAANRVLKNHGLPTHQIDAYRYFIGDGTAMLIRRALPETHRDETTIEAFLKEFRADYKENCFNDTKPYDGVYPLLEKLSKTAIRPAVLSNKPHEDTVRCIKKFFYNCRFDAVFGMSDGTPPKPVPEGALNISEIFRIPPAQFIFLGDSSVDMKTAINARMTPVGAAWGFRTEKELLASGARHVIKRPEDLLDILD